MNLLRCQSSDELAVVVISELRKLQGQVGGPVRAFVPTGQSPRGVYKAMTMEREFWKKNLLPFQIDEFLDLSRIFYEELKRNLLAPLGLENAASCIDPAWSEAEMLGHVEDTLAAGIHGALLGLGPNGHVGFHEPGYGASFTGGRLTVAGETQSRASGATDQVYTFGVGAFMRARKIILIASGQGKENIFSRFLSSTSTAALPATLLKTHPGLTVVTDLI